MVAYRTEMAPDSSEAAREALCDGARSVDANDLYKFFHRYESRDGCSAATLSRSITLS